MSNFSISDDLMHGLTPYCNSEQILVWKDIKRYIADKNKIRIANTGLVNSGKSSLFNAFIHLLKKTSTLGNERFPTGAVRKTLVEDEELLWNNGYIVDTPGLDSNVCDDEKAFEAVMTSDIILLIHNVGLGDLHDKEDKWLKKICNEMNSSQEIFERLIVVISWIDGKDDESDFQRTLETIKRMVLDVTQIEIDVIAVSAKRYFVGCDKQDDLLIKRSNVKNLMDKVMEKAEKYSCKKELYLEEKLKYIVDATSSQLSKKLSELLEEKKIVESRVHLECKNKIEIWTNIIGKLKLKVAVLETLRRDYKHYKNICEDYEDDEDYYEDYYDKDYEKMKKKKKKKKRKKREAKSEVLSCIQQDVNSFIDRENIPVNRIVTKKIVVSRVEEMSANVKRALEYKIREKIKQNTNNIMIEIDLIKNLILKINQIKLIKKIQCK